MIQISKPMRTRVKFKNNFLLLFKTHFSTDTGLFCVTTYLHSPQSHLQNIPSLLPHIKRKKTCILLPTYCVYTKRSLTSFSSYFWMREILDYFSHPKIRRKRRCTLISLALVNPGQLRSASPQSPPLQKKLQLSTYIHFIVNSLCLLLIYQHFCVLHVGDQQWTQCSGRVPGGSIYPQTPNRTQIQLSPLPSAS